VRVEARSKALNSERRAKQIEALECPDRNDDGAVKKLKAEAAEKDEDEDEEG